MAQLFNGYKEVVTKTEMMVHFLRNCQITGFGMAKVFTDMFADCDKKEVKKYMHILRTLGVPVKRRGGYWYLRNKRVEL